MIATKRKPQKKAPAPARPDAAHGLDTIRGTVPGTGSIGVAVWAHREHVFWKAGYRIEFGPGDRTARNSDQDPMDWGSENVAIAEACTTILGILHRAQNLSDKAGKPALQRACTAVRKFRAKHATASKCTPAKLVGEISGALANANGRTRDTARPKSGDKSPHSKGTALVPVAAAVLDARAIAPLTTIEKRLLVQREKEIDRDKDAFQRVGAALLEIQQKRLYRGEYETFERYLGERWGMSRSDGYRHIKAAELSAIASPIGDKLGITLSSESHFRPLAKLQGSDEIVAVLGAVAKKVPKDADGRRPVTAEILAREVRDFVTPPEDLRKAARSAPPRSNPQSPIPNPSPPADDWQDDPQLAWPERIGNFRLGVLRFGKGLPLTWQQHFCDILRQLAKEIAL